MLYCSQCGNEIPGNMRFCTECGAAVGTGNMPVVPQTASLENGGVTLVAAEQARHVNDLAAALPTEPSATNVHAFIPRASTLRIITLTVAGMLIVLGLGASAWLWLREDKSLARDPQKDDIRAETAGLSNSVGRGDHVSQTRPTPSQPAFALPASSAPSLDTRSEILATLDGWVKATREHDFDRHMRYYASTIDVYYGHTNVSLDFVRSNRGKAFEKYRVLDVRLSRFDITLDAQRARATVTFDKSWRFEGEKVFAGSVRQIVWLGKVGDRWLITGEKDLQVY